VFELSVLEILLLEHPFVGVFIDEMEEFGQEGGGLDGEGGGESVVVEALLDVEEGVLVNFEGVVHWSKVCVSFCYEMNDFFISNDNDLN
jgi:hypothetical protein